MCSSEAVIANLGYTPMEDTSQDIPMLYIAVALPAQAKRPILIISRKKSRGQNDCNGKRPLEELNTLTLHETAV